MTFKEAFAKARKAKGAGKTFTWNGKSYSTNYAEEASSAPKKSPRPKKSTAPKSSSRPKKRASGSIDVKFVGDKIGASNPPTQKSTKAIPVKALKQRASTAIARSEGQKSSRRSWLGLRRSELDKRKPSKPKPKLGGRGAK